jgi:hypothetical protein
MEIDTCSVRTHTCTHTYTGTCSGQGVVSGDGGNKELASGSGSGSGSGGEEEGDDVGVLPRSATQHGDALMQVLCCAGSADMCGCVCVPGIDVCMCVPECMFWYKNS